LSGNCQHFLSNYIFSVAVCGKTWAGNYQLMDEESTRGMIIPLGITSSGTRNPLEECFSAGNYKLIDRITHGWNCLDILFVIYYSVFTLPMNSQTSPLTKVTSSWTVGKIKMREKSSEQ
jgi:hypothetical protein